MLKDRTRPIYDYRRHLIVLGADGSAFVYRDTFHGEGSPRVNMLAAPDGYQAALAWVDRQFPASSVRARPTVFRGTMPPYIAHDMTRPAGYYVIEHATRGCFVGMRDNPNGTTLKAKFRWSVPRSDHSIERFSTRKQADDMLASLAIKGCYVVALGG